MEDIRTLDRLAVGQKATVAALSAPEDQRIWGSSPAALLPRFRRAPGATR